MRLRRRSDEDRITVLLSPLETSESPLLEGSRTAVLLEDQRDLVQEYRRERALIKLRQSYLLIMSLALAIFLTVIVAGGMGSIVARAAKLSPQSLPSTSSPAKGDEAPLGIRSLMSAWSIFPAQVALGATPALIVYLAFYSSLLTVKDLQAQTPATLAVLSFIDGLSEPFFPDVVGKIRGKVAWGSPAGYVLLPIAPSRSMPRAIGAPPATRNPGAG